MKKQNGITLISLIITIIVMVILAGIALFFSVGENGVITKAEETKTVQSNAEELEKVSLAIVNAKTSNLSSLNGEPEFDETLIKQVIEKEFGTGSCDVEKVSDYFVVTIKKTNNKYKVTEDGKVEKMDENEENGNEVPPAGDEEVEWVYIDYWGEGEEELRYIGKSTNLELVEDKEVKAYVGTLDEETEEMVYDENCEIISVRLSKVPYIFYEDIEELTVGELAKNISCFDGAKKVIILKEFGDVVADTFDDRGIEEVVIEEGIKNIESSAFGKNDLISVTLPKSIESIGDYAFSYSFKLETINYAGKISEWENIEKGTNIVNSSLNVKLICSDGIIDL